nr:DMT family transporter [Modestobacter versicolor]
MTTGAALLAVASSIGYGVGDVLAGVAVRRHTASSVALWVQLLAVVMLTGGVFLQRPEPTVPGLVWGGVAGVLGALGVLAFYTALQNGPTSIVAPVSGAGVVIPLVGGLVTGEQLSVSAIVGLVAVVAGILVIALRSDNASHTTDIWPRRPLGAPGRSQVAPVHDQCRPFAYARPALAAVLLSVVAAVGFGSFFIIVDVAIASAAPTSDDGLALATALLVALAVQAGSLLVTVLAASRHTLRCVRPSARLLGVAGAIAVLDVASDVALTYAIGVGPLAVVGPLGSLDPVVAVLIAAVFLRERVNRWQLVGVALALAGIGLVSS